MRKMKADFRKIIDPVNERRSKSGAFVRAIYAIGIIIFFSIMAWNFGRELFFLEGTGVISSKKRVISYPFPVRVTAVNVVPGSDVHRGDLIANVESFSVEQIGAQLVIQIAELATKIADLEIRKNIAMEIQPFTQKRMSASSDISAKLEAGVAGSGSSQYKMQVYLDHVSAAEANAKINSEIKGIFEQLIVLKKAQTVLEAQYSEIKSMLNGGQIYADIDAVVSADVPIPGEVVQAGDPVFTLFERNDLFVIWEIPLRRLVEPEVGDRVYITSGYSVIEGHIEAIFPISTGQGSNRSTQFTGTFQGQRARVRNRGFDHFLPIESQVVVRMSYTTLINRLFSMLEPRVPR
jgi:multidrug resistance efflux pump